MRSAVSVFLLLVQISCHIGLGLHNQETVYIKPLPTNTCPGRGMPYYTLMQYVTNQSSASNVRLVLLSGTHELTSRYHVANKSSVSITAYNLEMSNTVHVECNSSGRMSFRSLELVRISGAYFIGSGGNKTVSVTSFMLDNASFMNGSINESGGAWSIHLSTTLMFINCTFANNVVMGSLIGGGVLHILTSEGYNLTISQCTFSRNAVIDPLSRQSLATVSGGALHIISAETDSVVKIVESVFTNNKVSSTSAKGGALYSSKANITISACIFEDNEAIGTSSDDDSRTFGGALHAESTNLAIHNSTFMNNKAKGTTSYTHGGAVYASKTNLIFNESLCIGNQANSIGYGGALYISETNSIISKSIFKSNQANGSYSQGGALYSIFYSSFNRGKTVIKKSTFSNNHANYSGGALHIVGTLNPIITGCKFSNNRLLQLFAQGGAIYVTYSAGLTMVSCLFHSNSAAEHFEKGGALYTSSTYTHLQECTFFSNGLDIDGGAVYVELDDPYGTIFAYRCNFYKNTGGAINYMVLTLERYLYT